MSTPPAPETAPAPMPPGASGDPAHGAVLFFGREPALWLGLVAALVQLGALLMGWSGAQQAVINALAVAIAGGITAYVVHEGQVAALLGVIKAALALAIGFGLHLPAQDQSVAMAILTAIGALVTRSQVVAPVARTGRRVIVDDLLAGRV